METEKPASQVAPPKPASKAVKAFVNLTHAGKGRVRGVPNRATADVRRAIALVAQNKAPQLETWLDQTAEGIKRLDKDGNVTGNYVVFPDPGKAAALLLSALEYHLPKLNRTEHTGEGGGPLVIRAAKDDETL